MSDDTLRAARDLVGGRRVTGSAAWVATGLLALLALLALGASPLPAQEPAPLAPRAGELRVFLDCQTGCDADYIRTETPWVAFVRDRTVADVHILLTGLGTGAGGQEYTVALVGQGAFGTRQDTLRFVSQPGQAPDLVRQGLTRTIHLGLVPFVARTGGATRLRVTAEGDDRPSGAAAPAADPWRAWVLNVGLSGSFEEEARQREVDLDASAGARRITDNWKIGVSANVSLDRDRFELDDRVVTNDQESYSGGAVLVRSLGAHWGAGVQAAASSSTFQNTRLALRTAPAVEYSVWPYVEATRRQLTVQYSVGVSGFRYREETIFDRMSETRPTQALVIGYDAQQPWGSADAALEAASFLDNARQHRLEADASLDLRLVRGLRLQLGGRASLIRDQLAIVKRDATPEEILLQRRALLTDYRYSAFVGINYTFGSIFSAVVNPRFGTGPGQILR